MAGFIVVLCSIHRKSSETGVRIQGLKSACIGGRTIADHVGSREARHMANPLLTPAEAGEQLGLTPAALAQLRYTGGGPCFIKLTAKAVRYRQSDLDSWIAAKARSSTRDYNTAR